MEKTIKYLQSLLPCEQFTVTGSYVLKLMGLVDSIGDLDVILYKPTEETINILKRLDESGKEQYPGQKMYTLTHEGNKVEIFITSVKEEVVILESGVNISLIKNIIKAKQGYNRLKDWLQLRKIASLFFVNENFNKFLDAETLKQTTKKK